MLFPRSHVRGTTVLGVLALLLAVAGPLPASAGDLVGFGVSYSIDGETFLEEVEVAPGMMVMVRIELSPGPGGLMDVMGEDDFDFSRIGPAVETLALRGGKGEEGPCYIVIDEEGDRLLVRCPFCDISSNDTGLMEFTIQVREDAEPGPISQVLRLWDIGTGDKGEDRPCTTEGPEPIGDPLDEEDRDLEIRVIAPLVEIETRVSDDGATYGPEVDVETGDDVFFRVRIRNRGGIGFFETSVESLFPAGYRDLEIISAGPAPCEIVGDQIRCDDLGGIEPGGQLEVVFKATVDAPEGILESVVETTVTPGSFENPGTSITDRSGARVRVGIVEPIPALDTIGVLLLVGALGFALVLYGRRS